jgi:hypothetical protein
MLLALVLLQAAVSGAVERTGAFASPRLTESSGVVVSRSHPGLLWSHNDSGDEAFLYATDLHGADRGRVRIPGIVPLDAEDLADGPCPTSPGRCLYLADTGDNGESRDWVALYAVPEPAAPAGPADVDGSSAAPSALRLRYPDRPHDVEAVFVTDSGTAYLVTKGRRGGVAVYRVPRAAWARGGVATAEFVQALAIEPAVPLVTGAALSPDGARVAVRGYGAIAFFALRADGGLAPHGPACDVRGHEPQGEAVAFLDARRLVITSEGTRVAPGPIHIVTCPQ